MSGRTNTTALGNASDGTPVTILNICQSYFMYECTILVEMLYRNEEHTPRRNNILRKLMSGKNNNIETDEETSHISILEAQHGTSETLKEERNVHCSCSLKFFMWTEKNKEQILT